MEPQPITVDHQNAPSRRRFWLHYLEMVVVMFAGMGIFSGLAALAFGAAGSSVSDQAGWFRVLLMGITMTVPMVAWMALRGHPAMRSAEMAASMMVPTAIAAALVAAGVFGTGAGMLVQHVVMLPAMLGVMLWRYDEYARSHHRHR
ncbi:hypothetical protein [Jiangella mangrovi]|uniref:Uncharacterized membrane protein YhaH (DUF805 family) n=1 Tax=Jiangella mangrovi TaxID=1524084 RepID=A0A7W9LMC6_9ACTN|nr:hypothetical protein [Jiangella mangrovi]MBB5788952.1 uncharacterized membrane protein YhaH (DUF805 family) [Jiangella mangrovi]